MVCKMVKKGVLGAVLGAGALALLFGTAAPSYVKTAFCRARQAVKAEVPFEFEIDRARQEIAALDPAIERNLEALAKAEVAVENLERQVVATRDDLNREGRELVALKDMIQDGNRLTGGVSYTPAELKGELARRFDHYKLLKQTLAAREETLKARQKNVVAAREQLDIAKAARRDLMAKIEAVEARHNQIKATRQASEFEFDDSAVGRAKQIVSDLETRLDEMAKIDELKGQYLDHPTIKVEPGRDVVKEVEDEFGSCCDKATVAEKNL